MIKRLPREVVARIASGQIASSPAAVLKELIENALDAKASEVKVQVETPFNFRVSDNGIGIPYRELPLAVERFTTSKIFSVEELERVTSYGFRGEALFAISQFSTLEIKSRHEAEEVGGKLVVTAGEVKEYSPIPFRRGTTVTVSNLFFNVPVRRKATSQKERSLMERLTLRYALANPHVTFKFGELTLPATSLKERLIQVTRGKPKFQLIEGDGVTLFFSREERGPRELFVNRRPVSVPEVERLLEEFGVKAFVLFMELPPEEVDFNVSPLKEKVLFKSERGVKALRELLEGEFNLPKPSVQRAKAEEDTGPIELIGSDGTVLIAHDRKFYYFFDQHLIHERVNYEELLKALFAGKVKKVKLVPPVTVPVTVKEKLDAIHAVYAESEKGLTVYEAPELITPEEIKKLESQPLETVASVACRRAVKAGYVFKEFKELESLFNRYLRCAEKERCPHGRPIYYKVRKQVIYSHLGRKRI
ncbi:DNA mismatch repair protein domain protein [Thermovibrio ammonificans HB-1]|uniref:DNA mismatch repair protein MutL n=1 Tax=Thermovibrio ammonificans (strain DSM 15698 / JCM 12110 / HB-1) TaxID=648996 RepID=E8T2A3_THEA1|nr:DNA mismatch repair endonuclease MutL [Thermovibrio ammonificans]ADU96998.1 DNA mismatch repair protein domain protein [Thermovibrio ammonificans HB-1]